MLCLFCACLLIENQLKSFYTSESVVGIEDALFKKKSGMNLKKLKLAVFDPVSGAKGFVLHWTFYAKYFYVETFVYSSYFYVFSADKTQILFQLKLMMELLH